MEIAKQFIEYEGRSDSNKARLRGTFNTFANIPLRVTPSREEQKFNNAEFEWMLCNRLPTCTTTNGKRNDISKMQVRHQHRGRQTLPEMPHQQRTDAGARHYAGYMYHYDAECRPNSVQGTSRPST
jgi:hypothetical protein